MSQPVPPTPAALSAATASLPAPLAVVDLDVLDANAQGIRERAGSVPVRLATKSVRVPWVVEHALASRVFTGLMCYSLPEALWYAARLPESPVVTDALAGERVDLLVAYPTTQLAALKELAGDERALDVVSVMVDSVEHVDLIASAVGRGSRMRVGIDVDASLRLGPVHLGVRRSPLREPEDVLRVARAAQDAGLRVAGLMFYDAQIAGVPDSSRAVRIMKQRSNVQLMERRSAIVEALRGTAELDYVNGGGTGSLHVTGHDACLTELAAGSGLFCPTLFDHYDAFTAAPAAFFALPVVRRPAPGIVTAFSGGYVASGPAGADRVPQILPEHGLKLVGTEGTGEVQTPLKGRRADSLRIGDKVWFRHAKAGEMMERFDEVALIRGGGLVDRVPTYRGEGLNFG